MNMHPRQGVMANIFVQVRSGNLIELEGRLYQVTKHQHTHGHGRQLGNVQVRTALHGQGNF